MANDTLLPRSIVSRSYATKGRQYLPGNRTLAYKEYAGIGHGSGGRYLGRMTGP
ncbi:hypothetical protein GALMADRAFT_257303 [Galerina marginata CBS 339.88]|uniref:Uncharacterized protein n=1 Tax=Galerina marginata (strain CBS 339.88) TaxID=685588 RepID=A0A067SMR0_GALM3|nr:hypothetical protein GALMADRAFT_257303 [Galerina marginata CBS 339.88]